MFPGGLVGFRARSTPYFFYDTSPLTQTQLEFNKPDQFAIDSFRDMTTFQHPLEWIICIMLELS